ncbi:LysM peptidoglycan-binding domain-containing protein [Brevibacillus choshinensis]|uniref:LysM peptidoglycan-binding domain-containing protein n=3 Tax=Brevibacillus choshinensis TaxID=54911 RepID=UPI002E21CE10|nr:LysM peptidoglycan-binding domain-containing protein [Brevibacillus choshinensis]
MYAPVSFPPYAYAIPISDARAHQNHCICMSKQEDELRKMFRTLWEQHVAWTRMVIISIAGSLPDEDLTTKRLLRNPGDMANVLKPFYGNENAAHFEKLFTEHLVIAVQLVKAAKAGNNRAAADAERRWYANADEIASFLHSINPFWSEEVLRAMLHEHLALTKNQAVFRLTKDYASDIATFDKIEQQALEMADAFSDGVVKQFSTYFEC